MHLVIRLSPFLSDARWDGAGTLSSGSVLYILALFAYTASGVYPQQNNSIRSFLSRIVGRLYCHCKVCIDISR